MPVFRYTARDSDGGRARGTIEGESARDAARRLVAAGLYPSDLRERRAIPAWDFPGLRQLRPFRRRVAPHERIVFVGRLATLLGAGVPMLSSLELLCGQTETAGLRRVVQDMKAMVEEGRPLSEAMARSKDVFHPVHVAIVAAGEFSGTLDVCLERLAAAMERDHEARERAREAMRYPRIVFAAASLGVVFLMVFAVPRFAAVFEKIEAPLPLPTQALMAMSHFARDGAPVAALAAAAAWLLFRRLAATAGGRLRIDAAIIKAPLIGEAAAYISMARWANALGALMKSGAPLLKSLELSAGAAGNAHIAASLEAAALRVAEGDGLAGPLRAAGVPDIAARMIEAGEAAGAVDDMLFKARDFFENEAQRKIKAMTAMMEPALIVSLGLFVLFLALAALMPMWDMARLARGGL